MIIITKSHSISTVVRGFGWLPVTSSHGHFITCHSTFATVSSSHPCYNTACSEPTESKVCWVSSTLLLHHRHGANHHQVIGSVACVIERLNSCLIFSCTFRNISYFNYGREIMTPSEGFMELINFINPTLISKDV